MTKQAAGGSSGARPKRRPNARSGGKWTGGGPRADRKRGTSGRPAFKVVEREPAAPIEAGPLEPAVPKPRPPFRILLAVHRPRYRGRAVRASALSGWEITTLLNKQDVVGQVSKAPGPPDLVVLSGGFGRQKDYGIFRAIQRWRQQGMLLIGMVEDCDTAPEGFPGSAPSDLCDICLTPPYTAASLRELFVRLYQELRGEAAPPPKSALPEPESDELD